ncbi:MAG: glycoside hydrolase family 3 C-terminal domain-containing protein [Lachnospiraceae bacterium]|nr:glycoside hydrolase family 3 C-terminal domain-containing protein [Ruminococcus sp.]MCM1274007.1 glycoside hydrolase family 3 C-terminal domain-containing protein [Lachnospiraceae bacterium]
MSLPQFRFRDTSLTFDERVKALLEELSPEEKLSLITCRQQEIPRLGIKAFNIGSEAARGLVCRFKGESGSETELPTTVFPEPFGLAATFDTEIMRAMGETAGVEARIYNKQGHSSLCLWAPTVDLERDPRWGRTEEGYGEDPFLTGEMAAAYTKGMYGSDEKYARVIPTLKHFYANNHEEDRASDNASIPIALKHDYYLKAFGRPVKNGGARSVMTSYNMINGVEAMCNPELTECREKWGLLFSVTDGWDFIENVTRHKTDSSHTETIARVYKNRGADIITDERDVVETAARKALDEGLITESDIDNALFGVLKARFLLGEFDDDCPYNNIPQNLLCCREYQKTAKSAAEEAIILLRNKRMTLPLKKNERIAVVGVHADMNFRDWYTGYSERNATILDAITALVGRENLSYDTGNDVIALRNAENGFYFSVGDDGTFVCDAPLITESCLLELYEWGDDRVSLKSKYNGKFLSDCGVLKCVADEPYGWYVHEMFTFLRMGSECRLKNWQERFLYITENGEIAVSDKIKPPRGSLFDVELFDSGVDRVRRIVTEARSTVFFGGNNPMIGARECFDRKHLELPKRQRELADAILSINGDAVLFLVSGYPYAVDGRFGAVLHTPHSGPETGAAVARTLFGEISPAGRCPVTWYSSESELGSIKDYNLIRTESTYRYYEGEPLFPFGHGLTYTAFRYGALKLNKTAFKKGERAEVVFELRNVGSIASDEVVQLYVSAPRFSSAVPKKELKAFRRLHIPAGETAVVPLSFDIDELAMWDINKNDFTLFGGQYEIQVGASSADIMRTADITVNAEEYNGVDVTKAVPAASSWEYTGVEFLTDKALNEYALLKDWQSSICYENCRLNQERVIEITASNPATNATLRIFCVETGELAATVEIPTTGSMTSFVTVTADVAPLCGMKKLKFQPSGMLSLKSFKFFDKGDNNG